MPTPTLERGIVNNGGQEVANVAPFFDELFRGNFNPGLLLIRGGPQSGKSLIAAHLLLQAERHGLPSLLYNRETPDGNYLLKLRQLGCSRPNEIFTVNTDRIRRLNQLSALLSHWNPGGPSLIVIDSLTSLQGPKQRRSNGNPTAHNYELNRFNAECRFLKKAHELAATRDQTVVVIQHTCHYEAGTDANSYRYFRYQVQLLSQLARAQNGHNNDTTISVLCISPFRYHSDGLEIVAKYGDLPTHEPEDIFVD